MGCKGWSGQPLWVNFAIGSGLPKNNFFLRFGCNNRSRGWYLSFSLYGEDVKEKEGLKHGIRAAIFLLLFF